MKKIGPNIRVTKPNASESKHLYAIFKGKRLLSTAETTQLRDIDVIKISPGFNECHILVYRPLVFETKGQIKDFMVSLSSVGLDKGYEVKRIKYVVVE